MCVPEKRIQRANTGDRRRRTSEAPGYAKGNDKWNTAHYAESVKTSQTDTKVLKNPVETVRKGQYYYDNTVSAVRERRRENFDTRRKMWREAARKNRRRRLVLRRVLSLFIICGAVVAAGFTSYKLFFVTSDVTVTGSESYTTEQIISAAGLDEKTNLFSFSSRVASNSIKFNCPRVASAVIDRTIPNKVEITVEEEKPVFYAEIYGDLYGISDSLRIMEKLSSEDTVGLIKLKLQTVSYAVAGGRLVLLSDRAQSFLEKVVSVLNASPLKEKLTQIDLRNDFDIVMVAEDRYKLIFGTQDDFEIKVRLVAAMLEDEVFKSGSKAIINLEDTTKTSVIIDNQLVFD